MLPDAFVTHLVPGRVRIRIPSRKRDGAFFSSLKERFSSLPGIRQIEINPATGSVLVLHDLKLDSAEIAQFSSYTEANGIFRLSAPQFPGQKENKPPFAFRKRFGESVRNFDEKMREWTSGEIDLATLSFLLLLGIGIYQMSAGNFTAPAWYVAFWYAMNIFIQADAREKT